MPLPTALVVKNGSKILAITSGVMPQPVSSTSISTYSPRATPWPASFWLSRSVMLRVRMVRRPPFGSIASRALTARLMMMRSSSPGSALTCHRSRHGEDLQLDLLAEQAVDQHRPVGQQVADLQHLGLHRLAAREGEQLADEAGRAVGARLDRQDLRVDGVAGLVRLQQQVGEADDRGQHVVEVVGDAAGQRADRLHLLRLGELLLERLRLGHVDHVEDRALAGAAAAGERRHVDLARQLLALGADRDVERRRCWPCLRGRPPVRRRPCGRSRDRTCRAARAGCRRAARCRRAAGGRTRRWR